MSREEEYIIQEFLTELCEIRSHYAEYLQSSGYTDRFSDAEKHQHLLDFRDFVFHGNSNFDFHRRYSAEDKNRLLNSPQFHALVSIRNVLFSEKDSLVDTPLYALYAPYLRNIIAGLESMEIQIKTEDFISFVLYLDLMNNIVRCEEILDFARTSQPYKKTQPLTSES